MKRTLYIRKNEYVMTEDNEIVLHGSFQEGTPSSDDVFAVRITDRIPGCNAYGCMLGENIHGFIEGENLKCGGIYLAQVVSPAHDGKVSKLSTTVNINGDFAALCVDTLVKEGVNKEKSYKGVRVSKKITDDTLKNRISSLFFNELKDESLGRLLPPICDVIARTSCMDYLALTSQGNCGCRINDEKEKITQDLLTLANSWHEIESRYKDKYLANGACGLVFGIPDVIGYIMKQERTSSFDEIIVDSPQKCLTLQQNHPELADKIRTHIQGGMYDLFQVYSLDTEIVSLLRRNVYLESGARIVIEKTEALVSIDVNSGKNNKSDALSVNLEAAKEIMRQLRFRNLGGIIICDFINMKTPEENNLLFAKLNELAEKDPVTTRVVDMTPLGLVEITRRRR